VPYAVETASFSIIGDNVETTLVKSILSLSTF